MTTPQDGQRRPPPPPSWPPYTSPGSPPEPSKRRWPWIVLGAILLCGLPLGGCLALVGIGVSEFNEVTGAIESDASVFLAATQSGEASAIEAQLDGGTGCLANEDLLAQAFVLGEQLDPASTWEFSGTRFVTRSGGSTFSVNADQDTFVVPGREDTSTAQTTATITGADGATIEVVLDLLRPDSTWFVCQMTAS